MFPDESRRIFRHEHRGEALAFDPLAVSRALTRAVTDEDLADLGRAYSTDLAEIRDEERRNVLLNIVHPAEERLAQVGRETFGFGPVAPDGSGMTDEEALAILWAYLEWERAAKKDGGTSPDSPPTTAGPPASS